MIEAVWMVVGGMWLGVGVRALETAWRHHEVARRLFELTIGGGK